MKTVLIGTVSRWELAKQLMKQLKDEDIRVIALPEEAMHERRILRAAVMWSFQSDLFVGLWDEDTVIEGEQAPFLRKLAASDEKPILDIFPQEDPEEAGHILDVIRKALKK